MIDAELPDNLELEVLIACIRFFLAGRRGCTVNEIESDVPLSLEETAIVIAQLQMDNNITFPTVFDPPLVPTIASIARVALDEVRKRPPRPKPGS